MMTPLGTHLKDMFVLILQTLQGTGYMADDDLHPLAIPTLCRFCF